VALSDTFTGTNGTLISARNTDSGHTWTKLSGDGSNFFEIDGNRADPGGTAGAEYISNYAPGTADYYVEVVTDYIANTNYYAEIGIRAESDGDGYFLCFDDFSDEIRLVVKSAGTSTETTLDSMAYVRSDVTFRLEANGTTIRVLQDAVEVMSATDSVMSGAGTVFLGKFGSSGALMFASISADVLAGGGATVTAVPVDGTGDIAVPAVAAGAVVTSPVLDGTGDIAAPAVSSGTNATVVAVPLDATGDVANPALSAGSTVVSPVLDATGDVATAGMPMSAALDAVTLDATGDVAVPVVSSVGGGGSTVIAVPLDATGDVANPAVVAGAVVTAVTLDATGDVGTPEATGGTPPVGGASRMLLGVG
jgi:hypothetical protein